MKGRRRRRYCPGDNQVQPVVPVAAWLAQPATMSATTHSKVRSAAGGCRCWLFTIASGLVGWDVRLLELAFGSLSEVNGDTGFELRGGMGCHVGQDGRAILHAVDEPGGEAGDEHGTDQGGAQRGTSLVT
jgi:hypothetical protein